MKKNLKLSRGREQFRIFYRILDKDLYINGLSDIAIPVSHFSSLDPSAEKIFITENKINLSHYLSGSDPPSFSLSSSDTANQMRKGKKTEKRL